MVIETDHNFPVAFFILIAFCLSWTPLIVALFLPDSTFSAADAATVNFVFVWFAIGGPSSKLLVLIIVNHEFRLGICSLCLSICRCCFCRRGSQGKEEYCSLADARYRINY